MIYNPPSQESNLPQPLPSLPSPPTGPPDEYPKPRSEPVLLREWYIPSHEWPREHIRYGVISRVNNIGLSHQRVLSPYIGASDDWAATQATPHYSQLGSDETAGGNPQAFHADSRQLRGSDALQAPAPTAFPAAAFDIGATPQQFRSDFSTPV